MSRLKSAALVLFAGLVVAGHIGLWRSPDYETAVKWRLTILNALGWGIVILPALAVSMWARAHRRRD